MKHAKWQFFGIRASILALVVGLFVVVSCSDDPTGSPECLSASISGGQVIQWNYNGTATVEGTGCHAFDTTFIISGNQMSIVFTNLGVALNSWTDGKTIDKKTCRIMAPVKIKAGWYIEDLYHTMTYGYVRSEGTGDEVVLESQLLGKAAGKIRRSIPTPDYDPWDQPDIDVTVKSTFGSDWCSQSDITGLYEVELTVSGFRENLAKSITAQIDLLDIQPHPPLGDI